MRLTITGATGLVGNNLLRRLLADGHEVRVTARPTSSPRPLDGLEVEAIRGDVTDPRFARRIAEDCDGVLHCAAMIWIGRTKLQLARDVNVEATRSIAAACRASRVRMIHVSSVDALAPSVGARPCDEQDVFPAKPACSYTTSKREAERAVLAEVECGLDATIVNPGFMIGPYDWTPSSGQMMLAIAKRFIPLAPGGGCCVADARDVAAGILSAFLHGRCGERYILGGCNVSYFDLWRMMADVTGSHGPVAAMGGRVSRVVGAAGELYRWVTRHELQVNLPALKMGQLFHYYDSSKAERQLAYATRPLPATLQDSWKWIRAEFLSPAGARKV